METFEWVTREGGSWKLFLTAKIDALILLYIFFILYFQYFSLSEMC